LVNWKKKLFSQGTDPLEVLGKSYIAMQTGAYAKDLISGKKKVSDVATDAYKSTQKGGAISNVFESVKSGNGVDLLSEADRIAKEERYREDEQKRYEDIKQREDTAFQRMVKDKKAAGLHPLAGISGSSTTGMTVAKAEGLKSENLHKALMNILAMKSMRADISKTYAETQAINEQAGITKAERRYLEKYGVSKGVISDMLKPIIRGTEYFGTIPKEVKGAYQRYKKGRIKVKQKDRRF
jgi:hypothetical protein